MAEKNAFFSVWVQDSPYWIVVEGAGAKALTGMSPIAHHPDICLKKVGPDWASEWQAIEQNIHKLSPAGMAHRAVVIASEQLPGIDEIRQLLKPVSEISSIAANLWLIEYVNQQRLGCYLQRVVDRRGKQVGYESFARMDAPDGGVIGGGAIMQAAIALRAEYQLDRLLHKQAIEQFIDANLEGYIFINFLTGFIHRPEVYLDGLSQAVQRSQMRASAVVLDVPISTNLLDTLKLKTIAEYCRARGFIMALDDVKSASGLAALLTDVRPAMVKIDRQFASGMTEGRRLGVLNEIVRLAHASGASVLAEGVENEAAHAQLMGAGVDMFQGYLFGAPERFPKAQAVPAKAKAKK